MVKVVSTFSLAEGQDPDKVWKYWIETHTPKVKKVPGLRKYVISRITKVTSGPNGTGQEPKYWGMAELWFDSEEVHNQSFGSLQKDDLGSMVCDMRSSFVEERVIVE